MSAEALAAKAAVAVASDKRGQIAIATILCSILMLFFLPLIVYMGVMSNLGEIEIDTAQAQQMMVQNMSSEEKAKLQHLEDVMVGISKEFQKRKLNNYTIKRAQALYACDLYNAEKSDSDFISKYADCFEQSATDEDLRNAVFSVFGVQINADEFNNLMSVIKNTVIDIDLTDTDIISTARKTDDGYDFCFDSTSIPNEYRTENTLQDDCPIFHQAMCILCGEDFRNSELLCEALRDVFVYVDFSGIFNRMPVGRILELQELAKEMFKPKGIRLNFGKEDMTYIAFERSASMSRDNRLSFVRSDIYEALKERMMLGMTIGKCQLSKLYAYNALLFTSGKRYDEEDILSEKRIIVIDNPEMVIKDVDIITVTDDGTNNPVRVYTRVQKKTDVKIAYI